MVNCEFLLTASDSHHAQIIDYERIFGSILVAVVFVTNQMSRYMNMWVRFDVDGIRFRYITTR